jgi:hypothetical protein
VLERASSFYFPFPEKIFSPGAASADDKAAAEIAA